MRKYTFLQYRLNKVGVGMFFAGEAGKKHPKFPDFSRSYFSHLIWILALLFFGGWWLARADSVSGVQEGYLLAGSLETGLAELVLEQPTLTPAYGNLCSTYWHGYTNERQQDAFLTLNAAAPEHSTNSGLWQPTLEQAGLYRVEAYLPDHGPWEWTCSNPRTIEQDTTQAHYWIQARSGLHEVVVNQAANAGQWVELGVYFFNAGSSGYVYLTDLSTGEAEFSRSISFSAMRFTWTGLPYSLNLPAAYAGALPGQSLSLQAVWAASRRGETQTQFTYEEQILLNALGINTGQPLEAGFSWQITSPCGDQVLPLQSAVLPGGLWQQSFTATLPACGGPYTATVQLSSAGITDTLATQWTTYPGSILNLRQQQAFDKCNAPSISQLATWKQSGPYGGVNLYIGGASRTCANSHLNRDWVRQAQEAGWALIPTWVGPQAPCTSSTFAHVFSYDLQTAFNEGRAEADMAYAAALNLGLLASDGSGVIYYDLEGFSYSLAPGCRAASQQFVWGWVSRMHELGLVGAVYGGACSSYMVDWLSSPFTPDAVWAASWYTDEYDPNATVWNLVCVNDELWPNHQRIHQYAGGHNETWGGVSMNIDSNAVDALLVTPRESTKPPETVSVAWESSPLIQAFERLDRGHGWLLQDGRLLWTVDGGGRWQEITPGAGLVQADFITPQQGWALGRAEGGWQLYRTQDGSQSWQTLAAVLPLDPAAQVKQFVWQDEQNGWLSARLPSSANFSLGRLLRTSDGGSSWQEIRLPAAGKLWVEGEQGWLRTVEGEWFVSADGGLNWAPAVKNAPPAEIIARLEPQSISFDGQLRQVQETSSAAVDSDWLWALESEASCRSDSASSDSERILICSRAQRLWASNDGGLSWEAIWP